MGLPFLQFCIKYDICNPDKAILGCAFGKKVQADNLKDANNSIARNIDF